MDAGDQLKELRTRLGMTTRDVEEFSRRIAEEESKEDFQLSNAWLTQLENTAAVPSIYNRRGPHENSKLSARDAP